MHKYISFTIIIVTKTMRNYFHLWWGGKKLALTNTYCLCLYDLAVKLQKMRRPLEIDCCRVLSADLYVVAVVDGWVEVGEDEVGVVGQPADQEQGHHPHHHLHHLGKWDN